MKRIVPILLALVVLIISCKEDVLIISCKEDCDKNDTGTIKVTNSNSQGVDIDFEGFLQITLAPGETSNEETLSSGPWDYTATLDDGTVEQDQIRIGKCELSEFTFQ